MDKLISIIIPCYNVEALLPQALESVLVQEYPALEIICINDGSPDSSLQVLEQYRQKDPRIKIIDQKNTGISGARNAGIKMASGEWIMFLDSDDWFEKDLFRTITPLIGKADMLGFSYNRVFVDNVKPRKLGLNGDFFARDIQRRVVGLLRKELADPSQANSAITVWGKVYRTRIIKENNISFVDTKLIGSAEDALFSLSYLEHCKTVHYVDIPLYNHRKTEPSFTKNYKPQLLAQWNNLYSRISEIIQAKDESFHEALNNRICLGMIGHSLNEAGSSNSVFVQSKNLKRILKDPLYEKAFSTLELQYFSPHWKLFFFFAKNKMTLPIVYMAKAMNYFINKK